ncbi:pyridoxamine 5'-phosphate oxidase family protein [Pseudarthrobacter sp. NamE5]|uniref:pyridoxamine 5'-phosphate oxidase family protein n=1 Tax=Pseudarthrobacter sp. NamE5 TaxID=2576839 RepID=UPI00110C1975|nr:pyridoxamine 5'-phosphate oxidase family protein [Pseudarthrobacter sp. NamE5]TLM83522.1 pyridoxamine 5'-phosphate oxidase family protein [Pseudarthrobacter sp. NamE5]
MGTATPGSATHVLTVEECWKLLASSYIGRLAVIDGSTPEIFPVNFVPLERAIFFRTAPGTKLRSLLTGNPVALETDALNVYGTEVWSVVVKGTPTPVQDGDMPLDLADPDREPWEQGLKEHLVRIVPTEVTGRRFNVHTRTRWWPPDFSSDWI